MTEKNYNPKQKEKKAMKKQKKVRKSDAKITVPEEKPAETKKKETRPSDTELKEEAKTPEKTEKKPVQEKPKKTEAFVKAYNLPISTKHSAAVCKFIKKKKIEDAIADLEQVLRLKKSIPMKGEIPHRKGKGSMSGRFPRNTTKNFIKLLKSLSANAIYNSLEEPVIVEAVANIGSRPRGRFGRVRRKRTHVIIIARSKQKETK